MWRGNRNTFIKLHFGDVMLCTQICLNWSLYDFMLMQRGNRNAFIIKLHFVIIQERCLRTRGDNYLFKKIQLYFF